MIVNLHRSNSVNVGDLSSSPSLYFPFLKSAKVLDLVGYSTESDFTSRRKWHHAVSAASLIIIGGGGLLSNDFFTSALDTVFCTKKPNTKVILWGAGHNAWQITDWRYMKHTIDWFRTPFDMVGLRDEGHDQRWVPCASCMAAEIDEVRGIDPVREVGLVIHEGTAKTPGLFNRLPSGIDVCANDAKLTDLLAFVAGCEIVLTDSYHGMYWSTLIGRKCVAFPSSSKFYDAKFPVPLCAPMDWQRHRRLAIVYPEALDVCREANLAFARDVEEVTKLAIKT